MVLLLLSFHKLGGSSTTVSHVTLIYGVSTLELHFPLGLKLPCAAFSEVTFIVSKVSENECVLGWLGGGGQSCGPLGPILGGTAASSFPLLDDQRAGRHHYHTSLCWLSALSISFHGLLRLLCRNRPWLPLWLFWESTRNAFQRLLVLFSSNLDWYRFQFLSRLGQPQLWLRDHCWENARLLPPWLLSCMFLKSAWWSPKPLQHLLNVFLRGLFVDN